MSVPLASYCIGIDVGGTNTDAVLVETAAANNRNIKLVRKAKVATTPDVTSGIKHALEQINIQDVISSVQCVMIGTTHLVNAVVERNTSALRRVALLRMCTEATRMCPPFIDFPQELKEIICGGVFIVSGGHEYDGSEIHEMPSKEDLRRIVLDHLVPNQVHHIVLSGVFSPVNPSHEIEVSKLLHEIWKEENLSPQPRITLSHHFANVGLIERENAAVLNASLQNLAVKMVRSLREALDSFALHHVPFFLTRNDGTLLPVEEALDFPIRACNSGPTNSMRGAHLLCGLEKAIVVDIGGTTSDVGELANSGLPRMSALNTKTLAGVRTNMRLPDVLTVGLGGGSIIRLGTADDAAVQIGPDSVGFRLQQEGVSFGGKVLTLTDIALSTGSLDIPAATHKEKVLEIMSKDKLAQIRKQAHDYLAETIDRVRVSKELLPVVLVGGGAALFETLALESYGIGSQVLRPLHYECANAIGAVVAQVSGSVERLVGLGDRPTARDEAIEETKRLAIQQCINRGGIESTIKIVEIDQVSVNYLPGHVSRISVTAVGDLCLESIKQHAVVDDVAGSSPQDLVTIDSNEHSYQNLASKSASRKPSAVSYYSDHVPRINHETKTWTLTTEDIDILSAGASLMGSGGGGTTFQPKLISKKRIGEDKIEIRVIPPEALSDDDLVLPIGMMGAPTVTLEKPFAGIEGISLVNSMERITGRKITALLSAEMGGANGLYHIALAGYLGGKLPLVDVDTMARAFPELQMQSFYFYGGEPTPCVVCDDKGNQLVLSAVANRSTSSTPAYQWIERFFRSASVDMGCAIMIAFPPLNKKQIMQLTVPHSMSRAWHLGRSLLTSIEKKLDCVEALVRDHEARLLFRGKIIDVDRNIEHGFNRGVVTIESVQTDEGGSSSEQKEQLLVDVQNEFIRARYRLANGQIRTAAIVPDIIALINADSGEPIQTEDARYGLRVIVLVLPVDAKMQSERALAIVGPRAFGFTDIDENWKPLLCKPTVSLFDARQCP